MMFIIACFKMLLHLFPFHYSKSRYEATKAETIMQLINRLIIDEATK